MASFPVPASPSNRRAALQPLTLIFEDLKTAEQCASAMREIVDKTTAIKGRD